jgi:diadenosine tetraphosphate (Ap4A) HIT family hydrolase
LHACSAAELATQRPTTVLDCPYTDAAYRTDHGGTTKALTPHANVGLSEASARRILAEEKHQQSGMPSQRWEQANSKRRRNNEHNDEDDQGPLDPNNKTLFLFGLHKDVTGQIQQNTETGDALIIAALSRFRARHVRKPPGAETSSFCFVDFDSHDDAKACWEALNGTVKIHNVDLGIKWSTSQKKQKNDAKPSRLTEADAMDSSTVYFKIPGTDNVEKPGEAVRKWAEETLEDALADGGEKVITAKDEPALQVTLRVPQTDVSYGFLDFASHAAGSMAVASLTGNTDGGQVLKDVKGRPPLLDGFKFERKHFPADARKDCWFCLASESCEKHLITGVFDTCYAAMAKGPVHPGHVLLIPVQHSSEGALKNPEVAEEMDALKERLRQHASDAYNMDLFVFERAIQTKGGYHTHVQCIPFERKLGLRLQTTMQAQAKKFGFSLREINSDIGLSSVLKNGDEEGDGYFYAEIPTGGKEFKRFVYKASAGSRIQVPLQFGREALAAVLGKPDLAHWKSCVVDQEQEAELAASFRESLSKEVEG